MAKKKSAKAVSKLKDTSFTRDVDLFIDRARFLAPGEFFARGEELISSGTALCYACSRYVDTQARQLEKDGCHFETPRPHPDTAYRAASQTGLLCCGGSCQDSMSDEVVEALQILDRLAKG